MHTLVEQMLGYQLNRSAGTNQQDIQAIEAREDALRQSHRGEGNRDRIFPDSRIGTHFLGDGKGILKSTPQ